MPTLPKEIIPIGKFDMDKPYRWMDIWGHVVGTYISVMNCIEVVLYCIPFGSTPASVKWYNVSEIVFDLARDMI